MNYKNICIIFNFKWLVKKKCINYWKLEENQGVFFSKFLMYYLLTFKFNIDMDY